MDPDVKSWTRDDVAQWLRSIGYESYVRYFVENEIDGEALLALSTEELFSLVKKFGEVFKLGPVLKFNKALEHLRREMKLFECGGYKMEIAGNGNGRKSPPAMENAEKSIDEGTATDVEMLPSSEASGERTEVLVEVAGNPAATKRPPDEAHAVTETLAVYQPSVESKAIAVLNPVVTKQRSEESDSQSELESKPQSQSTPMGSGAASGGLSSVPGFQRSKYPPPTPLTAHMAKSYVVYFYQSSNFSPPPSDSLIRAYVSYAESPFEFSIIMEKKSGMAKKIGQVLNDFYEKDPCVFALSPEKFVRGTACAVKFAVDGNWYRSEILEVRGENVRVRYVDYGNCETVPKSALMSLKRDKFCTNPPLRIDCRLAAIPNDAQFTDEHKDDFFDLVDPMEKMFLVKFDQKDTRKPPYAIHLFDVVSNNNVNGIVRQMIGLDAKYTDPKPMVAAKAAGGRAVDEDDLMFFHGEYSSGGDTSD